MLRVSFGEAEELCKISDNDHVDFDASVNDGSAEDESVELEVGGDHGIEEDDGGGA